MEKELENNIPKPETESSTSQDVVGPDKRTRGTRKRGGKGKPTQEEPKGDDNVIHMDADASGEYVFKVPDDDEVVSEDLEGDIANKEIIIANLKRQKEIILKNAFPGTEEDDAEDIKRIDDQIAEEEDVLNRLKNALSSNKNEPLPSEPPSPPAQTEKAIVTTGIDATEEKIELTDEERKNIKEIFQQEDFKTAYASVLADFKKTFEKIYSSELLESDEQRKIELDSLRSRFDSNDQLVRLLPNASVADYIFNFLLNDYRAKFQEKNLDQDSVTPEPKAVEFVAESGVAPEVIQPVGGISTVPAPKTPSSVEKKELDKGWVESLPSGLSPSEYKKEFGDFFEANPAASPDVLREAQVGGAFFVGKLHDDQEDDYRLVIPRLDFLQSSQTYNMFRTFFTSNEISGSGDLYVIRPAIVEAGYMEDTWQLKQRGEIYVGDNPPIRNTVGADTQNRATSLESKPDTLVSQPTITPEVIQPVGEIPHRSLRTDLNADGTQKAVVATVPVREDESSAPVVLENSAGAPLVVEKTEGEGTPETSAESPEVQPEKITEKSGGVETPTVFDTAKKEVESSKALEEARLKFAEADVWLGKNGFTARDITAIEKLHAKDLEIYQRGVRVNLLESKRVIPPVLKFSDTVKKYVDSLGTSGAAFVDIRHAKKFFASDDQKTDFATGLKKYFETRKKYEDGKKQVARGVWEKMGGVELQKDLILKRDGIVDDRDREAATVEEVKVINELRSAIFEAAIVGEMERLNEDKISVAGPAEKGTLQKALDGVRNINPTVRRAFATAVATGVISLGVSTAGVGTLGVLAGYAGARYIRSLIAASVGTGVGELQGKFFGYLVEKAHNSSLSKFEKRLLSVKGEADFDKFIDDYARERSDIFKDYLLAKKIVVGSTIITSIALGAITSAELHGLLDVDLGDHPIIHSDQHNTPASLNSDNHGGGGHQSPPASHVEPSNSHSSVGMAPPDKDGNAIPLEKTGSSAPQKPFGPAYNGPKTDQDIVGAKPNPAETTPAGPKTSEVAEIGKNIPKAEHVFKGPALSPELEKIAGGAKSPEEVFRGDGVKLNVGELNNAAVVGKGGSAWSVVHKQLELLAKSGIEPQKLGLNISLDDINDHAKFSHALEMRTRGILEENGFISKSGEVRIASPDTRLGLTVVTDGKGATHFVITKPDVTNRPVFYEYHPTQRLSVPVNHVPPEVLPSHTPAPVRSGGVLYPRVNIDTVQTPEEIYSRPFGGSHEALDSLDKKGVAVGETIPKAAVSQTDIDAVANSHDVVPEPRPAGLEKTLPTVDHLVSEKTLTKLFPENSKYVYFSNYQKDIPKLRDFLENMGFSDAYIETRWKDLSHISVGEFQKHIDEILKHKANATLLSQPIHPVHFNKDLASKILSYNQGADIPAEDRLYKIADLITEKKEIIDRNDLLQKGSVAQFIVDEALYSAPKK